MTAQPAGTVTLLFSDIEGSTRLLERLGRERYAEALIGACYVGCSIDRRSLTGGEALLQGIHSAGPFLQEWAVTYRRTHGPPEDILDDWGGCEFLSSFEPSRF